jgi:lipopolysaccharide transport system permease protein
MAKIKSKQKQDNYEVVISSDSLFDMNFSEILQYRDLFYILAWRDLKVRYKQTFLGVSWAIFQPLVSMFIFTVFFGNLAKIPSGSLPYPVFVLSGLVFWNFFSNSMTHASNSLIENENIVKKVYFPKIILPLATIITNTVDFGINLCLLGMTLLIFRISPSPLFFCFIPLAWLITAIASSGMGLLFSSINAKYRDVRYILPFFFQILIFLSPVIYGTNIISPKNRLIFALNPMTGVIELIRSSLARTNVDWLILSISTSMSIALFIVGIYFFNRIQKFFADIL